MAVVGNVSSGTKATAARMNLLFAELDRKMTLMFSGKSFICAYSQGVPVPRKFLGKCFLFTTEATSIAYSFAIPEVASITETEGYDPNTGLPITLTTTVRRNYTHSIFTTAAAATTYQSVDDTNSIMTVARIPSTNAAYANLPYSPYVSLFDHSLQTHSKLGTTGKGTVGKKYFLREGTLTTPSVTALPPEKFYKYAFAEIILEGQTTVDLPETYDKYCLFRIHNLNLVPATVTFGGAYTVTLKPLGITTVRRTRYVSDAGVATFTNYRRGYNYLFKFESRDPRFFAYHPTSWSNTGYGTTPAIGFGSGQYPVSNSMAANNLTCAGLLYDWIQEFTRIGYSTTDKLCWWNRDPHTVYNCYSGNSSQFGNPATSTTLVGDLIHHKGKIILIKRLKSNDAIRTYDTIQFRGYATVVADFAAKGITVAENAQGNLKLSVTDPSNLYYYDLIPVGTNMFKNQANLPGGMRSLHYKMDAETPLVIETALFWSDTTGHFEQGVGSNTSSAQRRTWLTAPNAVCVKRSLTETAESRRSYGVGQTPGGPTYETVAGAANRKTIGYVADSATVKALTGIHEITVADLLKMDWWGHNDGTDQNTTHNEYVDKSLVLTPEGLKLLYTERVRKDALPTLGRSSYHDNDNINYDEYTPPDPDATDATKKDYFWRKKVIHFYGHGWSTPYLGYDYASYFTPTRGRPIVTGLLNRITNTNGGDFDLQLQTPKETDVQVLKRIPTSKLSLSANSPFDRFWRLTGARNLIGSGDIGYKVDGLVELSSHYQVSTWYNTSVPGQLFTAISFPTQLLNIYQNDTNLNLVSMQLMGEHYNNMAAWVNSITGIKPISYRALKANTGGTVYGLVADHDSYGGYVIQPNIVPIDYFAQVDTSSGQPTALYTALGITVRTADDLPTSYQTLRVGYNVQHNFSIDTTATLSGAYHVAAGLDGHSFYANVQVDATIVEQADTNVFQGRAYLQLEPDYLSYHYLNLDYISLPTTYGSLRWVKTSDIKAYCESIELPFVYREWFEPYALEKLAKGDTIEETINDATATYSDVLICNSWIIRQGSIAESNQLSIDYINAWGAQTGTCPVTRLKEVICFRKVNTTVEADWKKFINTSAPPVVQQRKDRDTKWPEHYFFNVGFHLAWDSSAANFQKTWDQIATTTGLYHLLVNNEYHRDRYNAVLVNRPTIHANNGQIVQYGRPYDLVSHWDIVVQAIGDLHIVLEFSGNDDSYEKWAQFSQNETWVIACKSDISTTIGGVAYTTTVSGSVYYYPEPHWRHTADAWAAGDIETWAWYSRPYQKYFTTYANGGWPTYSMQSYLNQDNGGSESLLPTAQHAAATHKDEALIKGVNVFKATEGQRFKLLFNPEGPILTP